MRQRQETEEPGEPNAKSGDGAPQSAINENALDVLTRRFARLNLQAAALGACFQAVKSKG